MCSGLEAWTRRHMWVEFIVGSGLDWLSKQKINQLNNAPSAWNNRSYRMIERIEIQVWKKYRITLALGGFPGSTVFLSQRKQTQLNSNSIWKQRTKNLSAECATTNSYLFIFWCLTSRVSMRAKFLGRDNNTKMPPWLEPDISILQAIVSV